MSLTEYYRAELITTRLKAKINDAIYASYNIFTLESSFDTTRVHKYAIALHATFDAFNIRLLDEDAKSFVTFTTIPPASTRVQILETPPDVTAIQSLAGATEIDLCNGSPLSICYCRNVQKSRSQIILFTSHLCADYISWDILRTFTETFFGSGAIAEYPRYRHWLEVYSTYAKSKAGADEVRYWETIDESPFLQAGKIKKTYYGARRHEVLGTIGETLTAKLAANCREIWRCREADAVALCVCLGLSHFFNLHAVPIAWIAHGRYPKYGRTFSKTVGWLSDWHPLVVKCDRTPFSAAIHDLRTSLILLPNMGASFGWALNHGLDGSARELIGKFITLATINIRKQPGTHVRNREDPGGDRMAVSDVVSSAELPNGRDLSIYITADIGRELCIRAKISGNFSEQQGIKLMTVITNQLEIAGFSA